MAVLCAVKLDPVDPASQPSSLTAGPLSEVGGFRLCCIFGLVFDAGVLSAGDASEGRAIASRLVLFFLFALEEDAHRLPARDLCIDGWVVASSLTLKRVLFPPPSSVALLEFFPLLLFSKSFTAERLEGRTGWLPL